METARDEIVPCSSYCSQNTQHCALHSIGTPESLKVTVGVNDESPEGHTEEIGNGKKLQ